MTVQKDIVGDLHDKVMSGCNVRDIPIVCFPPDMELIAPWWDEIADKSLLIGVYKHGYDRFNLMRTDASLVFLSICGPPDGAALLAELSADIDEAKALEEDEPDTPATPATPQVEVASAAAAGVVKEEGGKSVGKGGEESEKKEEEKGSAETTPYLPFPSAPELNNRLRRLITAYTRNFKKEEARKVQKIRAKQRIERIEKFETMMRDKELKKREQAQKYVCFLPVCQSIYFTNS